MRAYTRGGLGTRTASQHNHFDSGEKLITFCAQSLANGLIRAKQKGVAITSQVLIHCFGCVSLLRIGEVGWGGLGGGDEVLPTGEACKATF